MTTSQDRLFQALRQKVETLTGERADGSRRALLTSDLTAVKASIVAAIEKITSAYSVAGNFAANAASKILLVATVWADASEKTVQIVGSTYTPDFGIGWNFILGTTQAANFTLANPTNMKVGQAGTIRIIQDAVGGRTWTLGSYWKTAFGVPVILSTSPNAVDHVHYKVITANVIEYSVSKAIG